MKLYKTFIKKMSACIAATVLVLTGVSFAPADQVYCSTEPDYQALADEIVVLVNEARAEAGLKAVYAVPVLYDYSQIRVAETVDNFSHNRPDGTGFYSILDENQIFYMAAAENIAAGNYDPEATFDQWRNSPKHWSSILNENYTHIGVGVCYVEGSKHGWYWEQLFIASDEVHEGQYLPERYATVPVSSGDIDGDGCITSLDLILMMKLLKHEVTLNDLQLESADCMVDGAHTIADAVVLKRYLLGEYNTLPIYP